MPVVEQERPRRQRRLDRAERDRAWQAEALAPSARMAAFEQVEHALGRSRLQARGKERVVDLALVVEEFDAQRGDADVLAQLFDHADRLFEEGGPTRGARAPEAEERLPLLFRCLELLRDSERLAKVL